MAIWPPMSAADVDTPLPDAAPSNWVDRFAPAWARPWLRLGRLDRPAGAWLLLLPCWQGLALFDARRSLPPDPGLYLAFAAGAFMMRAAGCAYNDIVDRDIDAQIQRTADRPIASGRISVRGAVLYLVLLSCASLLILLTMNLAAIVLGAASLGLVAIYPFMKRVTWWPQAWLGLTFNWGALMGYAAAAPGPSGYALLLGAKGPLGAALAAGPPPEAFALPALALYAAGVFWTLGYDTVYAVQDIEDDALVGVRSSARRLGSAAPAAVLVFYVVSASLAAAAGALARLGLLFYPMAAVYGLFLVVLGLRLRLDDPKGALAQFNANRTAGLILLLAISLGGLAP